LRDCVADLLRRVRRRRREEPALERVDAAHVQVVILGSAPSRTRWRHLGGLCCRAGRRERRVAIARRRGP
jgi:hypothetical protein